MHKDTLSRDTVEYIFGLPAANPVDCSGLSKLEALSQE
jgi:hypothetical protein